MAGDEANGTVVLFGGEDQNGVALDDTWVWDGSHWTEEVIPIAPPARWNASMAYDPVTKSVILVGGQAHGHLFDDTWSWTGNSWTQLTPPSSPDTWGAVAATAPDGRGVVLFGGQGNGRRSTDTWLWTGSAWSRLHPANHPPGNPMATFALDQRSQEDVLFGGIGRSEPGGDSDATWTWNGVDWDHVKESGPPASRESAGSSSLGADRGVLLFGGLTLDGPTGPRSDTWVWAHSRWTASSSPETPAGRELGLMALDSGNGTTVLFGGENASTVGYLTDTWIFRPN